MLKKKFIQQSGVAISKPQPHAKIKTLIETHFNTEINNNLNTLNSGLSDSEGLSKAYQSNNKVYVDGNKLYVSGTTPSPFGSLRNTRDFIQDWTDDFTRIPLGLTQLTERYKGAQNELLKNPQVDTIVGHSLGGSVASELNKNYGNKFKTTTYSAPILDLFKNNSVNDNNLRFKTNLDIVSSLDRNAITINKNTINPLSLHSYINYGDTGKTSSKGINYQIM